MGMIRIELDESRQVVNAPADAGEWYPTDTIIRPENAEGAPMAYGPLVISRTQPPGWPARAGRVWQGGRWVDDGTGAWLDELKRQAREQIDERAGAAREYYITSSPGQEGTYLLKQEQARAYRAAGYPADTTGYEMVQARADAYDETPQLAADTILAKAAQWAAVGAMIERERELGKRLVLAAATDSDAIDERDNAYAALDTLRPVP